MTSFTVNGACNSISGITERFMRVRTKCILAFFKSRKLMIKSFLISNSKLDILRGSA